MSPRMRFLGLALVLMILSSSLTANGRTLNSATHEHEQSQHARKLAEDGETEISDHLPSDVNDHHYIPRKDFSPHDEDVTGGST
ncbi:Tyrosine-protein kinase-like [Melia azedarach]|uniref:Tyrosine-protein kinase-like n=1 Tax=Melia azedarach TaxID=155640 RepID=A0ACC1YMN2_MELAZ|nr:Tyrosine-protein kinase-like [Melia azedarach]